MRGTAVILGPNVEPHDDPARVIGRSTTYRGDEHLYLRGYDVVIVAVLKDALRVEDQDGPAFLRSDDAQDRQPARTAEHEHRGAGGRTAEAEDASAT